MSDFKPENVRKKIAEIGCIALAFWVSGADISKIAHVIEIQVPLKLGNVRNPFKIMFSTFKGIFLPSDFASHLV